jgi:hypothetical protein
MPPSSYRFIGPFIRSAPDVRWGCPAALDQTQLFLTQKWWASGKPCRPVRAADLAPGDEETLIEGSKSGT